MFCMYYTFWVYHWTIYHSENIRTNVGIIFPNHSTLIENLDSKNENILNLFCCSLNGWCFLDKCFCKPGWRGNDCNVKWEKEVPSCSTVDDSCFVADCGVAVISRERWLYAQKMEQNLWKGNMDTNDRTNEHQAGFFNYKLLPPDLGITLEIGAGPWTQFQGILQKRPDIKATSITFWV